MKHSPPQYDSSRHIRAPQYYQPHRLNNMVVGQKIKPAHYYRRWLLVMGVGIFSIEGMLYVYFAPGTFHSQVQAQQRKTPVSAVNTILQQNTQYQIGIALIDTTTGHAQTFGTTSPFEAASTAKVLAACAYYHLVETGQANLTGPMGNYDAQFQLQEMINDSDNTSWNLIVNAMGANQLQAYADANGIVGFSEANNTLTPSAMATLLAKLYKGQLLNKADTQQLLSYMQNTNDESLIPAALPSSVIVYHKYGLLNGDLHDASIITQGNQTYVLVIYTNSSAGYADDDARTAVIHQLTQTIVGTIFPGSY